MRTTVADARDPELSDIPEVLQLCNDNSDGRLLSYLNQAIRRLLPKGQWKGTVVRYRICVTSECITWPRQVESVIGFAVCNWPGIIRSHWYEFLEYGPGQIFAGDSRWCAGTKLIDRGLAVAFDDICGKKKKIRVYLDNLNDAGKTILIQGYDENAQWVLTNNGTTNGEIVTLQAEPSTYVDTTTIWRPGPIVGVQKERTLGAVRLYELDTVTALQRPLATYEPDETKPQYRRSFVPGIMREGGCCTGNTTPADCTQKTITILAKLAFMPVRAETDYLLIQNLDALQDMVQSILKRKSNDFDNAIKYEVSALKTLEDELSNFHGDGTIDPVQVQNGAIYNGLHGIRSLV